MGFARRDWNDDHFRDHLGSGVKKHGTGFDARIWAEFARNISYFKGDLDKVADYEKLQSILDALEDQSAGRLYYLATAPDFYGPACDHLAAAGMSTEQSGH